MLAGCHYSELIVGRQWRLRAAPVWSCPLLTTENIAERDIAGPAMTLVDVGSDRRKVSESLAG